MDLKEQMNHKILLFEKKNISFCIKGEKNSQSLRRVIAKKRVILDTAL